MDAQALPIQPAAARLESKQPWRLLEMMSGRSIRVLCVDDEPRVGEVLHQILSRVIGALVETVGDNQSALTAISVRKPDLIISDIAHPGENGIELFTTLRANHQTSSIPFIFVSGQISRKPRLELQLFRKGADGVFPKPWLTEELIRRVKHLLHKPQTPDIDLLLLGSESRDLDYKQDLDLDSSLGRASFAKDVIAMANTGGGSIVIGVSEPSPGVFNLTGLSNDRLSGFETTRLNDSLRAYIGSSISITSRVVEYLSCRFIIVRVPSSGDTLAMPVRTHEGAGLFTGRIYGRTDAARTEEMRDSLEVLRLLDRIVAERIRRVFARKD